MNGEYIIDTWLDFYFREDYEETEEGERQCLDLSKNLSNTEKC